MFSRSVPPRSALCTVDLTNYISRTLNILMQWNTWMNIRCKHSCAIIPMLTKRLTALSTAAAQVEHSFYYYYLLFYFYFFVSIDNSARVTSSQCLLMLPARRRSTIESCPEAVWMCYAQTPESGKLWQLAESYIRF